MGVWICRKDSRACIGPHCDRKYTCSRAPILLLYLDLTTDVRKLSRQSPKLWTHGTHLTQHDLPVECHFVTRSTSNRHPASKCAHSRSKFVTDQTVRCSAHRPTSIRCSTCATQPRQSTLYSGTTPWRKVCGDGDDAAARLEPLTKPENEWVPCLCTLHIIYELGCFSSPQVNVSKTSTSICSANTHKTSDLRSTPMQLVNAARFVLYDMSLKMLFNFKPICWLDMQMCTLDSRAFDDVEKHGNPNLCTVRRDFRSMGYISSEKSLLQSPYSDVEISWSLNYHENPAGDIACTLLVQAWQSHSSEIMKTVLTWQIKYCIFR